ncbi:hypothetical protein ANN_03029 [Periplaneta americana]|uniref:Uncharacterized protein n=1 Tax=Periplaneta americana TaxID=6978 RepID=A0ABQ8U2P0_PERAM|nr:hypothetical protein ANN_03029 [Periplaneta americana]
MCKVAQVLEGVPVGETDGVCVCDIPLFKYARLTSCDVERSFSQYKSLFRDNRQAFVMENLLFTAILGEILTTPLLDSSTLLVARIQKARSNECITKNIFRKCDGGDNDAADDNYNADDEDNDDAYDHEDDNAAYEEEEEEIKIKENNIMLLLLMMMTMMTEEIYYNILRDHFRTNEAFV